MLSPIFSHGTSFLPILASTLFQPMFHNMALVPAWCTDSNDQCHHVVCDLDIQTLAGLYFVHNTVIHALVSLPSHHVVPSLDTGS